MRRLIVSVAVLLLVSSLSFAAQYEIVDLGSLYSGNPVSKAYSINNNGQIVGTSYRHIDPYPASAVREVAVRWDTTNGMQPIFENYADEYGSTACSINDNGVFVGTNYRLTQYYGSGGGSEGYIYDSSFNVLRKNNNWEHYKVTPSCINNNNQVVGNIRDYGQGHAFIWQNDELTMLDGYGLNSINDNGIAVGNEYTGDYTKAVKWSSETGFQPLGNFGYDRTFANSINNNNDIVGSVLNSSGQHPLIITSNQTYILNDVVGSCISINNNGQVIGLQWPYFGSKDKSFFIWDAENGVQDLTELIINGAGWAWNGDVTCINDNGQIVGYATNPDGYTHGFLLNEVPEPATLGLLAIGGFVLRKKK